MVKIMMFEDLSLPQFLDRFSNEDACLQAIYDAKWPHGFICLHCDHDDGYQLSERRSVECASCGRQSSILTGSVFEGTHIALRLWFLLIYFVAQDKGGASALKLAGWLRIRHATVLRMLRKLRCAMSEEEKTLKLAGYIEIDEAFLGGRRKVSEPGLSPFADKVEVAVLVENEGFRAGKLVLKVMDSDTREALQPIIAAHVESDTSKQKFIGDGKQHHTVVTTFGHTIKVCPIPKAELDATLPCLSLVISHLKRFFKGTYHHYCRQHIQNYLDEFCYRFNRRLKWYQIASRLIVSATRYATGLPAKSV